MEDNSTPIQNTPVNNITPSTDNTNSLSTGNLLSNLSQSSQQNFFTPDSIHKSIGQQMQETLFWDFANNSAPTTLVRMPSLSATYPNLLAGAKPSSNDDSWDNMSKDVMNQLKASNPYFNTETVQNSFADAGRYAKNLHNNVVDGYMRGIDNESFQADHQHGLELLGVGLLNVAEKTASVTVSSLGFLGALPAAILSGDPSSAADNWLSKWSNALYDDRSNEVFHDKDYNTGSVLNKLFKPDWWAETGADMAGFIIGNIIPATAIGKIGMLGNISKMLGNTLWETKAATSFLQATEAGEAAATAIPKVVQAANYLGKNTRWLNGLTNLETAAANSYTESVFEAADTKQRIYKQQLDAGKTPDEAMDIATSNANRTLGYNMMVLFPSSLWEVNALLKGQENLKSAIHYIKDGALIAPTVKDYLTSMGKHAIEGALVEGLWEENVQNSIQNVADKVSSGKISNSTGDALSSIISDTLINNFKDREGQENILGGVVMGVLMGGLKEGYSHVADNYKLAKSINDKHNSSYINEIQLAKDIMTLSNYEKNTDSYVHKNDDGTIALDDNNQIKINHSKLIADVKSLALQVDLSNTMASAAYNKIDDVFKLAKNQLIGEYVYNHMINGLEDRMWNKLDSFSNLSQEDKQQLGILFDEKDSKGDPISHAQQIEQIKQKTEEYKELFHHVDSLYPEVLFKDKSGAEYGYDTRSIFRESILNKSLGENLSDIETKKSEINNQIINTSLKEEKINDRYAEFRRENRGEIYTDEQRIKDFLNSNESSLFSKQLEELNTKSKEVNKELKTSNSRYRTLTDKKSVMEIINNTIKSKEEAESKIQEEADKKTKKAEPKVKTPEEIANEERAAADRDNIFNINDNPNNSDNSSTDDEDIPTYDEDFYQGEMNAFERAAAGLAPEVISQVKDNSFKFHGLTINIGDKYKEEGDEPTTWQVVMQNTLPGEEGIRVQKEGDPSIRKNITTLAQLEALQKIESVVPKTEVKQTKTNLKKAEQQPSVTQTGKNVVNQSSPVFWRIPNRNVFNEIFQDGVFSLSKDKVSELVKTTTPLQFNSGTTIKFSKVTEESRVAKYNILLPGGTGQNSLPNNPNILFHKGVAFDAALYYNGKNIGYLTDPNKYIFTSNGKEISVAEMTQQQFETIYDTNQKDAISLNEFKQQHEAMTRLYSELYNRLELNGSKDIEVSINELVDLKINSGSYDYSDNKEFTLDQLQYNTIFGETYIIDSQNIFDSKGKVVGRTNIVNFSDPARQEVVQNLVNDALTKQGNGIYNYGRYVAAVQLPNGDIKFVELTTPVISTKDKEKLLEEFKKVQTKSFENIDKEQSTKQGRRIPINANINQQFNEDLNKNIFIALDQKGFRAKYEITATGAIKLVVTDYRTNGSNKVSDVYLNINLANLKSFGDLLDATNAAINEFNSKADGRKQLKNIPFTIKESGIKTNIDLYAGLKDLKKMNTSVKPGVTKDASLEVSVKDFNTTENSNPVQTTIIVSPQLGTQDTTQKTQVIVGSEDSQNIVKQIETLQKQIKEIEEDENLSNEESVIREQVIQSKITELINLLPKGDNIALKMIDSKESYENTTTLNEFKGFLTKNLPSYIATEDVDTLMHNIMSTGTTLGAFQVNMKSLENGLVKAVGGTIYTSENNAFKYHEAFHAVFRLLLNDKQIDDLLRKANKEVKVTQSMIDEFKNSSSLYTNLTDSQAGERILEEHIADKFDEWKVNKAIKTDNVIKEFFKKILLMTKAFLHRLGLGTQDMNVLFNDINTGKYKNTQIQNNRFTENSEFSDPQSELFTTSTALKLIQIGVEVTTDEKGNRVSTAKYLSQSKSTQMVNTISSIFLMRREAFRGKTSDLIDQIMDDYANLYNPINKVYTSKSKKEFNKIKDSLIQLHNAYARQYKKDDVGNYILDDNGNKIEIPSECRTAIKEAIQYNINQLGFKKSLNDDENDSVEDSVGPKTTSDYNLSQENIDSHENIPAFIRRHIGTAYKTVTDEFGNTELINGEPLIEAVNPNVVYNGLLKALANVYDPQVFLKRMIQYSKGNTESSLYINKLIQDTGFKFNSDGTYSVSKNYQLFNGFLKGFNQYRVDYLFSRMDANKQHVDIFLSNQKDVAQTQVSNWYNSFTTNYQDVIDSITVKKERNAFLASRKTVLDRINSFLDIQESKSDADVDKYANDTSIQLKEAYGIDLSKNFMYYSIVAGMKGERTEAQEAYYEAFKDVTPLTQDDIKQISKIIQEGKNPFVKSQTPEVQVDENGISNVEKEIDDAAIGRLTKIAANNAIFDETVGTSSFKNAQNKMVYGHQSPTFDLIRTTQLNSKDYRDSLMKDSYMKNNFLLNNDKFNWLANQGNLLIQRIDGLRQVTLSENSTGKLFENRQLDINNREGIVYGDFNVRDFAIMNYNLYLTSITHNEKGNNLKAINYLDENNEKKQMFTANHLIRVIEASNTGDTIALPINHTFDKNGITNTALDILEDEVLTEYNRITLVKKEIDDIASGVKTFGIIKGYHTSEKGKEPRGIKFFNMNNALGSLAKKLETDAQNNVAFSTQNKNEIRKQLREYFNNQVRQHIDYLIDSNVITKDKEGKITNLLLPKEIANGLKTDDKYDQALSQKVFLTNDIRLNIGQVYMNDYINTLSYNQLLSGDESTQVDGPVNAVKRAKSRNNSGASIFSSIIAPELGINHVFTHSHILTIKEPKFTNDLGEMDRADAQMWGTIKSFRYTLFGLGKLNQKISDFLTKIENGIPVTKEDIFGNKDLEGSIDYNGQTSVLKLAYADGVKNIKISMLVLTKQLTSYQDKNGKWLALPQMEELHDKREMMEEFEERNNTVSFMIPESGSKMLTEDVVDNFKDAKDGNWKALDNNFWKLQTENPSNKTTISDPTQAKQLIDSEQDDNVEASIEGSAVLKQWFGKNKITVGDLRNIYQDSSSQRVETNYLKARNLIFDITGKKDLSDDIDNSKVTPNLINFLKNARETLEASGADSQLLGFFDVDSNGKPKYDLNMPMTLDKYTQLFLSYFSKGVLREKTPGHAITLASDQGVRVMRIVKSLNEDGTVKEFEIVKMNQFRRNTHLANNLKQEENGQLAVGDVYMSDLKHKVPEYNEKGEITGYYSEGMIAPHFAEAMDLKPGDKIPDALAKAFGVRIPSDDKHSFIAIKLIDFLPANYGSTGIFAKELIQTSGADFDVDKLYLSIASFYKNNEGKLVKYGEAKTLEDKFEELRHYEINNNKDLKRLVNDKLQASEDYKKNNQLLDISKQTSSLSKEDLKSVLDENSAIKKVAINEALKEMGLPSTQEEFNKVTDNGNKEINVGTLTNKILEAKIALQTNDFVRSYSDTTAGVTALKSLINDSDLRNALNLPEGYDVNSIVGKILGFLNNKEGANGIGPAVNMSLVYSLLNKYNIMLRSGEAKKKSSDRDKTVNIYVGTGENTILSNFAERPFTFGGMSYKNVEAAFQHTKLIYSDQMVNQPKEIQTAKWSELTGTQAKSLGRKFQGLDTKEWDKQSPAIMKSLIKASFEQNPEALAKLKETGNGKLTHTQDKSRWNNEFPKILMEVRKELVGEKSVNITENVVDKFFKLSIDGNSYNGYNRRIADDGQRIMQNIAVIEAAMTDNAKEQLSSIFNIPTHAVSVLVNMLSQGLDLKTSVSILLQPSIKEYFKNIKNFEANYKSSEDGIIDGKKVKKREVSKALLDKIQQTVPKGMFNTKYEITREGLLEATRSSTFDPMLQWKVLDSYIKLQSQTSSVSSIANVIKLGTGLGTNFEYIDDIENTLNELGIGQTDEEFEDNNSAIDVRDVLTNKHKISATNIKVMRQISQLAKSMFIEKTSTFKRISDIVLANMDFSKDMYNLEDNVIKLKRNLISYLAIKAYMKDMADQGRVERLTTLSNKILYDKLNEGDNFMNIVEIVKLAKQNAPKNYFINKFLNMIPTSIIQHDGRVVANTSNKDGINKIEANTWAKISNSRAELLQDSFRELYADRNTRSFALAIFNYLIVKDGLQFKSGSFIKFIPNAVFSDILNSSNKVNELMKLSTTTSNQEELSKKYISLFGVDQKGLFNEFSKVYLSNINNSFHIPQITNIVKNKVSKQAINFKDDTKTQLKIDIFADTRDDDFESFTTNKYVGGLESLREQAGPETQGNFVKDNFSRNLNDVKESGFSIRGEKGKNKKGEDITKLLVQFPYVIKVQDGSLTRYYRLESVGKKTSKNTEENVVSNFINSDSNLAEGTKAVYKEFNLKGVRNQTPIAEMFGEIPDAKNFLKKPNSVLGMSIKDYQQMSQNPTMLNSLGFKDTQSVLDISGYGTTQIETREGDMPDISFEGEFNEALAIDSFMKNQEAEEKENEAKDTTPPELASYSSINFDDLIDDEAKDNMKDMDSEEGDCGFSI